MQKHVWFIQLLHVACWCMIGFEVWASSVQCSSWQLRECTVIVCKVLQRTVACGPGTIYCRYRGPSKPTLATIFAVFFLRWQGQVQNPEWRLVKGVRGIGGIRPFLSQVFNCHIDLFDHGRVNTTSNHSGCLSFSRNHLFRMTIVNICQHCQHLSAHVQLCKALDGSFGFPVDGFLGRTPQANAWDSSWPRFWRQRCERLLRGAVQLRPAFRRVLQAAAFLVIHIWSACDPHCIHVYHVLVTTATLAVRLYIWEAAILAAQCPAHRPPITWKPSLKMSQCAPCCFTETFGTETLQERQMGLNGACMGMRSMLNVAHEMQARS